MNVALPVANQSGMRDLPVMAIEGARALVEDGLQNIAVRFDRASGTIARLDGEEHADRVRDGRGLVALAGIVDFHGGAFERQIMPRPRIHFPLDVALIDSDRQAIANGITTVFHGVAARPRIVAVLVCGRIVHLAESGRLRRSTFPRAQVTGAVA